MRGVRREMSARLSAPIVPGGRADLLKAQVQSEFAQDCLSTPVGESRRRAFYVTSARVRATAETLTDHDRQVLGLLSTVMLASGRQIREVVWGEGSSAARSARRQLAGLVSKRVVARQCIRIGGVRSGSEGYAYSLDVTGQYLTENVNRRRRPRQIGALTIRHALAVTDCYLEVCRLESQGAVELVGFSSEPECWRSFNGPGGARLTLKPDAYLVTGSGEFLDHWFIEVDRATESIGRIATKAEGYVRYERSGREQEREGVFPRVLWVVPDDERKDEITSVLSRLPATAWQIFQVSTCAGFAATIAAGAGEGAS